MTQEGEGAQSSLDVILIEAHEAGDNLKLVTLYRDAADQAQARGDIDACCFYLTHAYVFALETGHPDADVIHARLIAHNRDE